MRRCLALMVLVSILLMSSAQAQFYIRDGSLSHSWTCSLVSLAASLTQCIGVPSPSTQAYSITDIVVGTTTATSGTYSVQAGTGTNCATNTVPLFPARNTADRFNAPVTANPSTMISFTTPITAPAGNAICVIGVGTNTINIQLSGFLK